MKFGVIKQQQGLVFSVDLYRLVAQTCPMLFQWSLATTASEIVGTLFASDFRVELP